MKKIIIALTVSCVLGLCVVLGACTDTTSKTAWAAQIGSDTHASLIYSTVTVNKDGQATSVEIGEAFFPTGKLSISNENPSYRNPWYPAAASIATHIKDLTVEEKQAAIEDKYFISVDGKVYTLSLMQQTAGGNSALALVFKSGDIALTNKYLADNIEWYINAVKADKVFISDKNGTRLAKTAKIELPNGNEVDADFSNKALLKNHADSNYQIERGLGGADFIRAMKDISDFAKEKNFAIEFEQSESGNFEGLRVKDLVLSTPTGTESIPVSSGTPASPSSYLNYVASYMKVAIQAFNSAK